MYIRRSSCEGHHLNSPVRVEPTTTTVFTLAADTTVSTTTNIAATTTSSSTCRNVFVHSTPNLLPLFKRPSVHFSGHTMIAGIFRTPEPLESVKKQNGTIAEQ